jgi:hypothetical protein
MEKRDNDVTKIQISSEFKEFSKTKFPRRLTPSSVPYWNVGDYFEVMASDHVVESFSVGS